MAGSFHLDIRFLKINCRKICYAGVGFCGNHLEGGFDKNKIRFNIAHIVCIYVINFKALLGKYIYENPVNVCIFIFGYFFIDTLISSSGFGVGLFKEGV